MLPLYKPERFFCAVQRSVAGTDLFNSKVYSSADWNYPHYHFSLYNLSSSSHQTDPCRCANSSRHQICLKCCPWLLILFPHPPLYQGTQPLAQAQIQKKWQGSPCLTFCLPRLKNITPPHQIQPWHLWTQYQSGVWFKRALWWNLNSGPYCRQPDLFNSIILSMQRTGKQTALHWQNF